MSRKPADLKLTPEPLTEEQEQRDLITLCADNAEQYPLFARLFHIPNGGWRAMKTAVLFKLMGVRPGVLDLFFPAMRVLPDGAICGGLWIELKRNSKDAKLSDNQKDWVRYLRSAGYAVAVCKGCCVAWNLLVWYHDLPAYDSRNARVDAPVTQGETHVFEHEGCG